MPHNNPAAQYNFDWFIRFYDAVGNISNSEMQDIWAKILAGEIDHPSTYSLRTIDILKNMSKEEALLFTKVCQHCVGNGDVLFLPHYDDYLERCGLTFSEVMYLDELGLINSNGMLILKMPVSTEPKVAFINSDYIVMTQAEEVDKTLTIKQFPLTDVGNEIATLVSGNLADEDFLFFAEKIRGQVHIKVSAHKINYIEANGNINYQLADVLTSIKQENQ